MCLKRLRDILDILNVLGSDKRHISYNTHQQGVPLVVSWQGQYLKFLYTIEYEGGEIETFTDIETGGGTFTLHPNVTTKAVYFSCTNVTKLIVNGEQLI